MHTALGIALVVLAAAVIMVGVAIVRLMVRHRLRFSQAFLYFLNVALTRYFWRTTVEGALDAAPGRGAVLVCNHRSSIDPLFVQMLLPRPIHYMVAGEYVKRRLLGWPLRVAQAIPVRRGGIDTAATRQAIRLAQAGELVGIFPEGRINTTDELMLPARPGVAMIALRARVPVIPLYLEGVPYGGHVLRPFITPARVRLRIGKPIDLAEYRARENEDGILEEATLHVMREIARLAGVEDFTPQIAGRRWKPDEEKEQAEAEEK